MKKRTKKLLLLAVLAYPVPACPQAISVQLLTPERDFGYFVGDIIATDAIITAAPGTTLDRQSLPVPGPLNSAIELRSIQVEDSPGKIRIHAEYQSFFAPERASETELPAFSVHLSAGTTRSTALIPAWPFQVSPLRISQRSIDDPSGLRRNHAVEPAAVGPYEERFVAALAAALLAALTLARNRGCLPGWRSATRPFATAERRIGRLARCGEDHEAAYRELHRAFDATAGHHLFKGDLQGFFRSHPRFTPVQTDVSNFFAASESRFFAPESQTLRPPVDVVKLAKSLRRLERLR